MLTEKNRNIIIVVAVISLIFMFFQGTQTQAVEFDFEGIGQSLADTFVELLNLLIESKVALIVIGVIILGYVIFGK